jgi:hypothetical protein
MFDVHLCSTENMYFHTPALMDMRELPKCCDIDMTKVTCPECIKIKKTIDSNKEHK